MRGQGNVDQEGLPLDWLPSVSLLPSDDVVGA